MDCGMKMVKYLLFAFNLIFFVVALVLIGVGAAVEIKYRDVAQLSGNAISGAPILLICVGVFILIVSFFGCCGAHKENYCMVSTFAALLVFIFILELAAGIAAFVLKNKIDGWMTTSVEKHINTITEDSLELFDKVQNKFGCCGATNLSDWENSSSYQEIGNKTATEQNIPQDERALKFVPDSCCVKLTENCGLKKNGTFYEGGCVIKFETFIKKNAATIGGIGLAIAFIQLIGIMFACCLMRTIKKQYEVV